MDKNFLDTLSKDGDAYSISSAEDLCNLSEYVNAGNDCDEKIFKLANDIDLSSVENFTPIGTYDNRFNGTFDGNGKTISNLKIVGEKYVGLFGFNTDKIQNVNLIDANVSGVEEVGGLVGDNDSGGNVNNCSVSGSVSGRNYVGGLVGWNHYGCINLVSNIYEGDGIIKNCSVSGSISGTEGVGALVGSNHGEIQNCTASGSVSRSWYVVDGLVGYNGGTIQNCTFSGTVSNHDEII